MGKMLTKAKALAVGSGYRGQTPDTCAEQCRSDLYHNVVNDEELNDYVVTVMKSGRFAERFNPVLLRKICGLVNQTLDCIGPCPSGDFKTDAEKQLAFGRYVCQESNLISEAACLYEVSKEKTPECDSKCSNKKKLRDAAVMTDDEFTSVSQLPILVERMCDYTECDTSCDYTVIRERCGAATARTYLNFNKKSIDTVVEQLRSYGFDIPMPSNCQNMGVTDN